MRQPLQEVFERRLEQFVSNKRISDCSFSKAEKKIAALAKRSAEIVKVKALGNIIRTIDDGDIKTVTYQVQYKYLIKQKGIVYQEEEVEVREAILNKDILIMDEEMNPYDFEGNDSAYFREEMDENEVRLSYKYNRLKAVQYAERWWNTYNPAYHKFENDCTNFISQCLHAGGAPMRGHPARGSGWWYRNKNWSYSWAVAHALRLHFGHSKSGLRTKEVSSPDQLLLGDVICYDFEGDGRFNHNTIVTGKDALGMPLVNAHTYNSRQRYWAYEDSSAYTPNIKYRFFTIVDG